VAWLDRVPEWAVLQARLERAVDAVPLFRTRPLAPPARLSTPRWTLDPDFDLSWHLRRQRAGEPADASAVLELAHKAATTAFDSAHPLWEFTLVDGLDGGRGALVMKLHHALTDGVGGMQLALLLFDRSEEASLLPAEVGGMGFDEPPAFPTGSADGRGELAEAALSHDLRVVADVARRGGAGLGPAVVRAARHPMTSTVGALETLASTWRFVAPVRATMSPLMTRRGLGRRLGMLRVGLADLRAAGAAVDGTVNDAFVAAVTGGLRRYHERHGAAVDELRITLPISTRRPGDPVAGDRLTLARFPVPVGVADPAERIRATGARCRVACAERAIPYSNTIAGALNLLPSSIVGGMLKCVDFLASDVPGFPFPVYLAGARLRGYYAFGPTIGAALNATLLSYDGTCYVGVTVDTDAVDDPDALFDCLRQGFDEVLSVADRRGAEVA
ncbi:MAG TPA: wax ester/triacylglycerol synthase domain-containing protein, partial [Acidimicrobiales bacterium]|nr:wax ester/triacylglycerol synthase domain-containing protein [Acidimicrobiales bacterium]